MRTKLTLNLDDLSVDSFDTSAAQKENGTVFGEQQCTCPTLCSCPGCETCGATCPATCAYTCDDPSCLGSCDGSCDSCRATKCYTGEITCTEPNTLDYC